jgi:hypothetical protein
MRWRSEVLSQYVLAKEAWGTAGGGVGGVEGAGAFILPGFPNMQSKSCHLSGDLEHESLRVPLPREGLGR